MSTATATHWTLKGTGYEFCNCDFGCGCNFGGFPNSKDGSCRAFVGMAIESGSCGGVDLSGVKCAAIVAWPKAIHEGHGECVFIVEQAATEQQIEAIVQILMGARGYLSRRYSYSGGAAMAVPDHVISAYRKLVTRGLFNAADKGNDHGR